MTDDVASFLWSADRPSLRQPEQLATPRAPAEAGIWIFVLGDMTIFGVFFIAFLVEAHRDRAAFISGSSQLVWPLGLLNTIVLLVSSLLVALATRQHRLGNAPSTRRLLLATSVCGGIFGAVKAAEYSIEVTRGQSAHADLFFTFYFVLTGIHLLHVAIGTGLVLIWRSRAAHLPGWARNRRFAETASVYWHMVDLLWVVIFALLYLVYLR